MRGKRKGERMGRGLVLKMGMLFVCVYSVLARCSWHLHGVV